MAEPTLTEVFGSGATQDATTITIVKSDLTGLTVSSSNRAEALLVGILRRAAAFLNETNRDANIEQSISIDLSQTPTFTTRTFNNVSSPYIRNTISVELDKVYGSNEIDPDDY